MASFTLASAQTQRLIAVQGSGSVTVPPDHAILTLGVSTKTTSASDAMRMTAKAVDAVIRILKGQGIPEKDMQTSDLSLNMIWSQRDEPRVTGYEARNMLRIRVQDLENLGALIDRLAHAGANRIEGITFGVTNRAELLEEARRRAVRDAISRAELYAQTAEVKLGVVLIIDEGGTGRPPAFGANMRMMEAAAMPIMSGEISIDANVTMRFAIDG